MNVRIDPEAEAELEAAFDYYEGKQTDLGSRFLDRFVESTRLIAAAPRQWPRDEAVRDVHRYRLDPFPYSIVYQVLPQCCLIVAVMNLKRRPGYWRNRLRRR